MPNIQKHIGNAIERLGSQAKLASKAGCSQQLISQLLKGEIGVTAEMAMKIDKATGGAVSKHDLRPDIFGAPKRREREGAAA
jgi:DNA-binding transcriptional regulator YdaS (Cro superfamily)